MKSKKTNGLVKALEVPESEPLAVVIEFQPLNREVLKGLSRKEKIAHSKNYFLGLSQNAKGILAKYRMRGIQTVWLNCTIYFQSGEEHSQEELRNCLEELEGLEEVLLLDVPARLVGE